MERVAIITDSCGDVTLESREEHDIFVFPLVVSGAGKEYKDGVTITAQKVYELQKTTVLKTASPAGEDVLEIFRQVKVKGYTHAVIVTLSSGLSGTYNAVRLMAEEQEELVIEVLDSRNGSIGYGAVVTILARLRDKGYSFEQLVESGKRLIENSFAYFSIDTLEHLERGGRIGKATAFVGTLLKIKPILSIEKEQGEIYVPAKVRGSKAVQGMLLQLIESQITKHPGQKFYIVIAQGGAPEAFEQLKEKLQRCYKTEALDILETHIGATLSTYLGSGMLGAGVIFDAE